MATTGRERFGPLRERRILFSALSLLGLLCFSLGCPPLLSAQAQPKENCLTPLIAAIHQQDAKEAVRLIHSGADLNARACGDRSGTTALIEAIVYNETEVVETLISKGADVNETAGRNETPLQIAAFHCRDNVAALLLAYGARVDGLDIDGYSALMYSTQNCPDGRIAALLLRSGARVNLQAKDGDTALTVATFYGNEHAVHLLVAAGADLTPKREDGETALTIARDRKVGRLPAHDRIYQFLLQVNQINAQARASAVRTPTAADSTN
jgi:ankyrin repeat protein